jgi:hypothetical protein
MMLRFGLKIIAAPVICTVIMQPGSYLYANDPVQASAALPGGGGIPGGDGYDSPAPNPPEKLAISPGGVDMRSGTYKHETVDLSIGDEGDGGLTLVRSLQAESLEKFNDYK